MVAAPAVAPPADAHFGQIDPSAICAPQLEQKAMGSPCFALMEQETTRLIAGTQGLRRFGQL
jgi:hypothetical protein